MRSETFLNYKSYRYLKLFLIFSLLASILYIANCSRFGTGGGTFLGLTYGVVAAFGMGVLMWYGVRKRAYYSQSTTLKGVLAFHIWLGLFLILLVPLHAGFQFGWNVHTAAFVLMALCILSGIWGAFAYISLAPEIESHRGGAGTKSLTEQFEIVSTELTKSVVGAPDKIKKIVERLDVQIVSNFRQAIGKPVTKTIDPNSAAAFMTGLSTDDRKIVLAAIALIDKKMTINFKLQTELANFFWIRVWLLIHLPLACAAMLTLLIHIFVVFYYW